jgi:hypothetical protein
VDASGSITPIDALLIINELNSKGSYNLPVPPTPPNAPPPFFDVNGDNILSPVDALLVINYLNESSAQAARAALPVSNPGGRSGMTAGRAAIAAAIELYLADEEAGKSLAREAVSDPGQGNFLARRRQNS